MPECSERAESIEAGQRIFAVDHRFMREGAAGAAIFFRHRGAEQTGRAGLGPHLARIEVLLVPFFEMRDEFGGDEASRLLLEERHIFGHPGRTRQIENVGHCRSIRCTFFTLIAFALFANHPFIAAIKRSNFARLAPTESRLASGLEPESFVEDSVCKIVEESASLRHRNGNPDADPDTAGREAC